MDHEQYRRDMSSYVQEGAKKYAEEVTSDLEEAIEAYQEFFDAHAVPTNATPEDFLVFLRGRGLDLVTPEAHEDSAGETSPIVRALSDDPKERYIVGTALFKEDLDAEDRLQNESEKEFHDPQAMPVHVPMLEHLLNREEARFVVRFAECVVGFKRVAALLEQAEALRHTADEGAEREVSLEAELRARQLPTLGMMKKRVVHERGEFGDVLAANREALRREARERTETMTDEEARTIFARAFHLSADDYESIFPKEPEA